jgi:tRNA-dihydrouridine synthase B
MQLANIHFHSRAILGPMAMTTDIPFRKICMDFGAGMAFAAMISADGITHGSTRTARYAVFDRNEHPIGVQLFGSSPQIMARGAWELAKLKPDVIDINAGCPVSKVYKLGAGAALLNDLKRMGEVIRGTADAAKNIPVSIKMRCGPNEKRIVAVNAAKVAEDNGVAFITVHARTRETPYAAKARWEWIRDVKKAVSVPVIGNGDIFTADDAVKMIHETGCDAVMISRGSLGNPWIFRQINHLLDTGELLPLPTFQERLEILLRHFDADIKERGDINGVCEMRKHICWYTRGLPGSGHLRNEIFKIEEASLARARLIQYFEKLEKGELIEDDGPNDEVDQRFRNRVLFWLPGALEDEVGG